MREAEPNPRQNESTGRTHTYKKQGTAGRPRPGTAAAGAERAACVPGTSGAAPGAGKAEGRRSRFTKKQLRTNILIGSLILVLIMALLLAALLPGCQQEAPSSSVSQPLAAVSAPSAVWDSSYNKDEMAIPVGEYADTILPETEDAGDEYVEETLFLGDSNTARMLLFNDVTNVNMSNGIGIESMGITSVLGLRCVRFSGMADCTMPQAVTIMQPRRIVINFGTNNAGMNVDSFINSYEAACAAVKEAYPYADLIVASVFPVSRNTTYGNVSQKGIDAFNLALVEMAQEEGYKFLNWSEALKDAATGYCKQGLMMGDGVHLNAAGMEAIFAYMRSHSFVTEDTRPKPLKAVPRRLPTPEGLFPKPPSASKSGDSESLSESVSSSSSSSSKPPPASSVASSSVATSSTQVPSVPDTPPPVTTINVFVQGSTGGTASGGGSGAPGQTITIVATYAPGDGYIFAGWSANLVPNADGTYSFTIPATAAGDIVIQALFTQEEPPPVDGGDPADPAAQ